MSERNLLPCPFCGGPAGIVMGLPGCEPCALVRRDAASWNARTSAPQASQPPQGASSLLPGEELVAARFDEHGQFVSSRTLSASPLPAPQEPADWVAMAYARLGVVRDIMAPEEVRAVQEFLGALYAAPAPQEPADPMDWPLPCDVKVGNGTHRKGTSLRSLVARMQMLHREAFGDPPSPEQQARNLAELQGYAAPAPVDPESQGSSEPLSSQGAEAGLQGAVPESVLLDAMQTNPRWQLSCEVLKFGKPGKWRVWKLRGNQFHSTDVKVLGEGDTPHEALQAALNTRSKALRDAGFTRRPSWKSLPNDGDDGEQSADAAVQNVASARRPDDPEVDRPISATQPASPARELTDEEIKRVHDTHACLPDLVGLNSQWSEILRFARAVLAADRALREHGR